MTFSVRDISLFKGIAAIACMLVMSMFYFPFEFRAFPGMNTKKILAAIALVILFFQLVRKHELRMDKDFLFLSVMAGLVGMCGVISVTYNNTEDYAYATYITSAWVWWGGAYTACQFIRWVHGRLTAELIISYLTAVCVMQCCLALAIDMNPDFKRWVVSIFVNIDMDFLTKNEQRLFGIGCALDVAGIRFALVLAAMMFVKMQKESTKWYADFGFFLAFFFITVVGNIIGRTAIVGLVVGFAYLGLVSLRQLKHVEMRYWALWRRALFILLIFVPLVVYFYQTDLRLQKNIRFGFEGFFSLVEKGRWEVTSNERLKSMYVWPDNPKTWAIGDGYFDSPSSTNPYYTGEYTKGYYMNSDVGYVRFIFYFGLLGLVMFSIFMFCVTMVCRKKLPRWKSLFLLLLAVHFIVWAKVATDTFLFFALFLCLDKEDVSEEYYVTADQNRSLSPKLNVSPNG